MNGSFQALDFSPLHSSLERWQRWARVSALLGLGVSFLAAFFLSQAFFRAYLVAYLFWLGIPLGSLGVLMIHNLTGGGWGTPVRSLLEAASKTLPLMALLFVPLLFGLKQLYPWAEGASDHQEFIKHVSVYLNVPFFIIRALIYFSVWGALAYFLNRHPFEDPVLKTNRLRRISAPGLLFLTLTITFASVDWAMSLEGQWYSTIYGLFYIGGFALSGLAFVTFLATLLFGKEPFSNVASPNHFHDLGNLLLAFVMLWAYFAFSQYLIIWSGNLVEEIPWYLRRTRGAWQGIALFLIVFHFIVPFLLLLSRDTKRRSSALLWVTGLLLAARWVDLFWLIKPAFVSEALHWLDLTTFAGIGGGWLGVFIASLKGRPLLTSEPASEAAAQTIPERAS